MVNESNFFILVSKKEFGDFSPKKFIIWTNDEKKENTNKFLCTTLFEENIKSIKANSDYIIVSLSNHIYIYNTSEVKLLMKIETNGSFSISPIKNLNFNYLIYGNEGSAKIYNLDILSLVSSVDAHKTSIDKISISYSNSMFATTSIKGTIIRVFSLSNFKKLYSFKRGINEYKIFNLSFDFKEKYLLVTSESGSIHLFEIGKKQNKNIDGSVLNNLYNKVSWVGNSLMSMVPLKLQEEDNITRSIACINSEEIKLHNLICIYGDYGYIEKEKSELKSLENSDISIDDEKYLSLKFVVLNIKGIFYKCSFDEKNKLIILGNSHDISKFKLLG